MRLYSHPFSSYCQKVLIALYENAIPFDFRLLTSGDERTAAEHAELWPLKRFPVLVDAGRTVVEASIIIEHLGLYHPGPVRAAVRARGADGGGGGRFQRRDQASGDGGAVGSAAGIAAGCRGCAAAAMEVAWYCGGA